MSKNKEILMVLLFLNIRIFVQLSNLIIVTMLKQQTYSDCLSEFTSEHKKIVIKN